eukprot:6328591-Lingulodinium_polyedra.AAC.1
MAARRESPKTSGKRGARGLRRRGDRRPGEQRKNTRRGLGRACLRLNAVRCGFRALPCGPFWSRFGFVARFRARFASCRG